MATSSVDTFLPQKDLLEINGSLSSGDERTSGWRNTYESSTVVGYFIADNAGAAANAELVIEQSIDQSEADITNTVSPTAAGNAQPFEFDLVGTNVKATITANENIDKVRAIVYQSTRTAPIQ